MLPDCEAGIRYCRWFQESVFNGLLDPELSFYSEETWFTLSGCVNSQNSIYWSTEILMLFMKCMRRIRKS
jgi:hypothetical protein